MKTFSQHSRGFALVMVMLLMVIIAVFGIMKFSSAKRVLDSAMTLTDRKEKEQNLQSEVERARALLFNFGILSNGSSPIPVQGTVASLLALPATSTAPYGANNFKGDLLSWNEQQSSNQFFRQIIQPELQNKGFAIATPILDTDSQFRTLPRNLGNDPGLQTIVIFEMGRRVIRQQPEDAGPTITFPMDYRIQVSSRFNQAPNSRDQITVTAEDRGLLEVSVIFQPGIFNWGFIRMLNASQTGGGAQFLRGRFNSNGVDIPAEVFTGRVHLNFRPLIQGDVRFYGSLTGVHAAPPANQNPLVSNDPGYAGQPTIDLYERAAGSLMDQSLASVNFNNALRLAGGDPGSLNPLDPPPAHNGAAVSAADLSSWLRQLADGPAPLPDPSAPTPAQLTETADLDGDGFFDTPSNGRIFVPLRLGTTQPIGGIYVDGTADHVFLRALRPVDVSTSVPLPHQTAIGFPAGCSLQMIQIETPIQRQTFYTTKSSCASAPSMTFIAFETKPNPSTYNPATFRPLPRPINGQIYVRGNIRNLTNADANGSSSRGGAAIQSDQQVNIVALGSIMIRSDLMYEDAQFHAVDPNTGRFNQDPLAATPWDVGVITQPNITARIPDESRSLLGIVSGDNIEIKGPTDDAAGDLMVSNINLHGIVFAAMRKTVAANGVDQCCGFGWRDPEATNPTAPARTLGSLKLLGSISEHRTIGVGRYFTAGYARGFTRSYHWDPRLRDLRLPGFPTANFALIQTRVIPTKAIRVSDASGYGGMP